MSNVNEDLFDATTSQRLHLLRFEAGVAQQIVDRYGEAVQPAVDALLALYKRIKRDPDNVTPIDLAQIGPLQRRLSEEIRKARADMEAALDAALTEAHEVEAQATYTHLRAALGDVAEVRPAVTIDSAAAVLEPIGGRTWHDRLAMDLLHVHDELQAALTLGATQGMSVPRLAKLIEASTGLTESYKGRFVSIARTEIQRVSNAAAMATYESNLDVVKGVQYLATLDSRTCVICAPMHNAVWMYGLGGVLEPHDEHGAWPVIPRHPRCRCFAAPVTKSWKELGIDLPDGRERRRLDGKSVLNTDFDTWLGRRGKATQNEILGPARGDLFRAGVPLKAFTDQGRVLRLGELRARLAAGA